jgi:hypothetical protein
MGKELGGSMPNNNTKEYEQYLQQIQRTAQAQRPLRMIGQVQQAIPIFQRQQQMRMQQLHFEQQKQQAELKEERNAFFDVMKNVTEVNQELVDWGTGLGIKGLQVGKTPKGLQLEEKQKYYSNLYKGKSATDLRAVVDDLRQRLDKIAPHETYYVPPARQDEYEDLKSRYNVALEQLEKVAGLDVETKVVNYGAMSDKDLNKLFLQGDKGAIAEAKKRGLVK